MSQNSKNGFSVRLSPELKRWVNDRADLNMRSLNAEINLLLSVVKSQIERKENQKVAR